MTSPGMAAYEVVLSRGLVLRLPADFDPDKVSQLLAAVSAVG
jgi:phage tail protein X